MMNPLIIIPARYQSTRFPGKPLAIINGKTMVQLTYEQAVKTGYTTVVATDDERIAAVVEEFGGTVVLTAVSHPNGTARCREAAQLVAEKAGKCFDVIINVQGDEPFIKPEQIQCLFEVFEDKTIDIATLAKKITEKEELQNSNVVKVVKNAQNKALYFSRAPIPFVRDFAPEEWLNKHSFFKHIGMYAYRNEALKEIVDLSKGELEVAESLEQLRWLENDYTIAVIETAYESIGIDTPEDLKRIDH